MKAKQLRRGFISESLNGRFPEINSFNRWIFLTIILKIIAIFMLYFSSTGQSSGYYINQRPILFIIFLFIALREVLRGSKYTAFIWIPFATLFNDFVPIYTHDFEFWKGLDYLIIVVTVLTIFFDIFRYHNAMFISDAVEHKIVKDKGRPIISKLMEKANEFLNAARDKDIYDFEINIYPDISKYLFYAINRYAGEMPVEAADFYMLKGIVDYHRFFNHSIAIDDFKQANKVNPNYRVPNTNEIPSLTFYNYKSILNTSGKEKY